MAHEPKDAPADVPGARAPKRPYAPPSIEQVTIVPDEAMFGFCKTSSGQPAALSQCGNGACQGLGS